MSAKIYDESDQACAKVDRLKAIYEPRILAYLNNLRDVVEDAGYRTTEVWDWADDEYVWRFEIFSPDNDTDEIGDHDIDVSFTIIESQVRDGDCYGISFMLDIVEYGGLIVGGLAPYNYTPQIWVDLDDAQAIDERFRIFEDSYDYSMVELIEEFWDRQGIEVVGS